MSVDIDMLVYAHRYRFPFGVHSKVPTAVALQLGRCSGAHCPAAGSPYRWIDFVVGNPFISKCFSRKLNNLVRFLYVG